MRQPEPITDYFFIAPDSLLYIAGGLRLHPALVKFKYFFFQLILRIEFILVFIIQVLGEFYFLALLLFENYPSNYKEHNKNNKDLHFFSPFPVSEKDTGFFVIYH